METLTFDQLPKAVKTILEQVQTLNQKIDNIQTGQSEPLDEDRYVDIHEIIKIIFPQWKKQTIYNRCHAGEIPHSRMGARLMFHIKECREWRDQLLQKGKIKALSQAENDAQTLFEKFQKKSKI